jgi:hypothetical protein
MPGSSPSSKVIKFLAGVFRGMSFIVGMTAPAPGEDERRFVFLWLGMIGVVILSCLLLFYLISHVPVP